MVLPTPFIRQVLSALHPGILIGDSIAMLNTVPIYDAPMGVYISFRWLLTSYTPLPYSRPSVDSSVHNPNYTFGDILTNRVGNKGCVMALQSVLLVCWKALYFKVVIEYIQ